MSGLDNDPILSLLNVQLDHTRLNAILHPTGAGGSTLLAGITGKMLIDGCSPSRNGSDTGKIAVLAFGEAPRRFVDRISDFLVKRINNIEELGAGQTSAATVEMLVQRGLMVFKEEYAPTCNRDGKFRIHGDSISQKLGKNTKLSGIVIDGLDTYINASESTVRAEKPHIHLAKRLKSYLTGLKLFAGRHSCPVWLTHHFRGAAFNSQYRALIPPQKADIANWFPEKFYSCFSLGTMNLEGWLRFDCAKPRQPNAKPLVIKRTNDCWFKVGDAAETQRFFVDPPQMSTEYYGEGVMGTLQLQAERHRQEIREQEGQRPILL